MSDIGDESDGRRPGGGFGDFNLRNPGGGPEWGEMIDALRDLLDTVASVSVDAATSAALAADLAAWSRRLAPDMVDEAEQIFGRRTDLAGRGQTMLPVIRYGDYQADGSFDATVTFGRYFLGGNGAAHGGAVALLFDEVLGRISNEGRSGARTAYLHTDFRSITPIGHKLDVHVHWVSEQGRKRRVRAELRDGDRLCAEAEGLFVTLLPGQP